MVIVEGLGFFIQKSGCNPLALVVDEQRYGLANHISTFRTNEMGLSRSMKTNRMIILHSQWGLFHQARDYLVFGLGICVCVCVCVCMCVCVCVCVCVCDMHPT